MISKKAAGFRYRVVWSKLYNFLDTKFFMIKMDIHLFDQSYIILLIPKFSWLIYRYRPIWSKLYNSVDTKVLMIKIEIHLSSQNYIILWIPKFWTKLKQQKVCWEVYLCRQRLTKFCRAQIFFKKKGQSIDQTQDFKHLLLWRHTCEISK